MKKAGLKTKNTRFSRRFPRKKLEHSPGTYPYVLVHMGNRIDHQKWNQVQLLLVESSVLVVISAAVRRRPSWKKKSARWAGNEFFLFSSILAFRTGWGCFWSTRFSRSAPFFQWTVGFVVVVQLDYYYSFRLKTNPSDEGKRVGKWFISQRESARVDPYRGSILVKCSTKCLELPR